VTEVMRVQTSRVPRFEAVAATLLDDPYPAYATFRASGPVVRAGPAQWVVTRYAEVSALLRDPRLGEEFPEAYNRAAKGHGPIASFFRRIIVNRDPPYHTAVRRLMSAAFTPRLVVELGPRITALADELLEPALERGRMDVVTDLAYPLPVRVACELIGVRAGDWDAIKPWVNDLAKAFTGFVPEADRGAADAALERLRGYMADLYEERRRAPASDLVSGMAAALAGGGPLSRDEVVDNLVFLLFAAYETTVQLISTGLVLLLRHPRDLERLRADPSLLPGAVEEFLRFDSPVHSVVRLVREPVEVGGQTIRAGRVVHLFLASANHDERQFDRPEELDVLRSPNPHLSFGGGAHYCMGSALARLQAALAIGRVLERCATIEPAGEPVQRNNRTFRSYASVPVALRPAEENHARRQAHGT
jgi:cytochrome P450